MQSENIQIFPITVASTFVTLSWNTSSALSTGRGYILQVRRTGGEVDGGGGGGGSGLGDRERNRSVKKDPEIIKQYEDIDVGLKMNSYTVNGLNPGVTYLFTLCLRRGEYVITISSAALTTREPQFQVYYCTVYTVVCVLVQTMSRFKWRASVVQLDLIRTGLTGNLGCLY